MRARTAGRVAGRAAGRAAAWTVLGALALAAPAGAEIVDKVAVVVDGEPITLSEVEERAAQQGAAEPGAGALKAAAEELVAEKLLARQVAAEGLEPTQAEIDSAIEDVKHNNRIDDKSLDAALAQQGLTRAAYRELLAKQLGRMKLVESKVRSRVQVTEDDVKARYAQVSRDIPQDEELRVRDIFVPAGEDRAAALQAARAALQRVRAGEDFAKVATETGGPLADSGGDLGWLKRGSMIPEIDKVAGTLPDGGVSEVVESAAGFHVVKVEARRKSGGVRPLSEAREELRQQILAERLARATDEYVADLKRAADIEYHLP